MFCADAFLAMYPASDRGTMYRYLLWEQTRKDLTEYINHTPEEQTPVSSSDLCHAADGSVYGNEMDPNRTIGENFRNLLLKARSGKFDALEAQRKKDREKIQEIGVLTRLEEEEQAAVYRELSAVLFRVDLNHYLAVRNRSVTEEKLTEAINRLLARDGFSFDRTYSEILQYALDLADGKPAGQTGRSIPAVIASLSPREKHALYRYLLWDKVLLAFHKERRKKGVRILQKGKGGVSDRLLRRMADEYVYGNSLDPDETFQEIYESCLQKVKLHPVRNGKRLRKADEQLATFAVTWRPEEKRVAFQLLRYPLAEQEITDYTMGQMIFLTEEEKAKAVRAYLSIDDLFHVRRKMYYEQVVDLVLLERTDNGQSFLELLSRFQNQFTEERIRNRELTESEEALITKILCSLLKVNREASRFWMRKGEKPCQTQSESAQNTD